MDYVCISIVLLLLQMLDADVFLTETDTLKILVRKDLPVVAPMLISDGLYYNFWLDSYQPTACLASDASAYTLQSVTLLSRNI
jgi:hypothetical protein